MTTVHLFGSVSLLTLSALGVAFHILAIISNSTGIEVLINPTAGKIDLGYLRPPAVA